jgi:phosphoglycerate dehydrogenase-like enzyme
MKEAAQMTSRDPIPVWFERAVLPELAAEVASTVTVLGPATDDDPYAGLATARGALAGAGRYDAAFMTNAPELRVIARTGIGYDAVDVREATRRGIAVCNTPDAPTVSTAEHAATLMLTVAKRVKRAERELAAGRSRGYFGGHQAIELEGKLLGLVGFGRIARHLAAIAGGLGMRVSAYDPFLSDAGFPPGVARASSLEQLLAGADVVSLHVPLSDDSRGMFGARQFELMKPGAVFINTARGALVEGDALLAALEAGRLFGAGLDVTDPEPLPPGHPLLLREDVVITPHVASATIEGKVRMFRAAFEQVVEVLHGRRPRHLVNPEVWQAFTSTTGGGMRA